MSEWVNSGLIQGNKTLVCIDLLFCNKYNCMVVYTYWGNFPQWWFFKIEIFQTLIALWHCITVSDLAQVLLRDFS